MLGPVRLLGVTYLSVRKRGYEFGEKWERKEESKMQRKETFKYLECGKRATSGREAQNHL